ncbi:MAG: M20/M25/M40 family metallo-hydrolase [Bacteroidetes bacterium]|nr:M20/M25/M40 family metallo-hydrolase [Bacteroidota bacterium]
MKTDLSSGNHKDLHTILSGATGLAEQIKPLRQLVLANLIMLGEAPAPTFQEERRMQLLIDRFSEVGLQNVANDETSNVYGLLDGTEGNSNMLVSAHMDTVYPESADHTISVQPDLVTGAGVADNSLGLAVVASLPDILHKLNIRFKNNLILIGTSRSVGRGNSEGLRSFLNNNTLPIQTGICVEGVQLDRLSHASIGIIRGEILVRTPEELDWNGFGNTSAILTLNEIINKITDIPLPRRPRSSIILGQVRGGAAINKRATKARLGFEARSESAEIVAEIEQSLHDAVAEVAAKTGDNIEIDILSVRKPGGIPFSHPLVRTSRKLFEALQINPRYEPSTSDLAAFIDYNIPALTMGITMGSNLQMEDENINPTHIHIGVAKLISMLMAIDGGHCNAE